MREAGIPLEVMWNDIDLYHDYRDFTTDPVSFPAEEMRSFIRELVGVKPGLSGRVIALNVLFPQADNHQYYIPIVDAGVAHQTNDTDVVSIFPYSIQT